MPLRAPRERRAPKNPKTALIKAGSLPPHLEAKVAEHGLDVEKIFVRTIDEAVKDAAWFESMKEHLGENRSNAGWTPSPEEVVQMIRNARESR